MGMATHDGGGRRYKFFKVLLPGTFELCLSIPPKFAAVLGGAAAELRLRDGTGRWWDVELHRDGDHGRLLLTGRGWRGFVSANGISAGHLLVFEHRGCLDFAVDLFDASGCLSEPSACRCENDEDGVDLDLKATAAASSCVILEEEATVGDKQEPGRRPGTGGVKRRKLISPMARASSTATITTGFGGVDESETLFCRRIDRPYQLRFLDLSKSFCDAVGWTSSRDVELICAAGVDGSDEQRRRSWPVSVKVSTKSGMMCAGWTEFAQDNRLGLSDACVFVPPPPPLLQHSHGTSVLQVHVIRGSASHADS